MHWIVYVVLAIAIYLTLRGSSHDPLNFITPNQQSAIPSDLFPIIS
ncbi:hypothetical protein J2T58_000573, partial [Methanocalculus alkaliphilus]|nr:hypothetical protein [Methanocalculus alkaliphilus]